MVFYIRKGDPLYDFPKRLHYSDNENIPPIMVLPRPDWRIARSRESNITFTIGQHGYDNKYKEMSTIFFAAGPSFKKNVTMEPIETVNLVPLLGYILGVEAKPNNGSIRVFDNVLLKNPRSEENAKPKKLNTDSSIRHEKGKSIDGLTEFTRFIYY